MDKIIKFLDDIAKTLWEVTEEMAIEALREIYGIEGGEENERHKL